MNINPFSNYALSFMKVSVNPALTVLQKKILAIILVVLGGLAAYCVCNRYIFKAEPLIVDKNPKEKLNETEENDKKEISDQFKISIPFQKQEVALLSIEERIASLKMNQIEAIAKKIIAQAMSHLKIDVYNGPVNGETYSDIKGNKHQVYMDLYKPSSTFMESLLPHTVKEIVHSFKHPSFFVSSGLEFRFVDSRYSNPQLIDHIIEGSMRLRINQAVDRILCNMKLNSMTLDINLNISKIDTDKHHPELYFSIDSKLNGAKIGNAGGYLTGLENNAIKSIV